MLTNSDLDLTSEYISAVNRTQLIIIKYAYIAPILIKNYSRRFTYRNIHLQMDKF